MRHLHAAVLVLVTLLSSVTPGGGVAEDHFSGTDPIDRAGVMVYADAAELSVSLPTSLYEYRTGGGIHYTATEMYLVNDTYGPIEVRCAEVTPVGDRSVSGSAAEIDTTLYGDTVVRVDYDVSSEHPRRLPTEEFSKCADICYIVDWHESEVTK